MAPPTAQAPPTHRHHPHTGSRRSTDSSKRRATPVRASYNSIHATVSSCTVLRRKHLTERLIIPPVVGARLRAPFKGARSACEGGGDVSEQREDRRRRGWGGVRCGAVAVGVGLKGAAGIPVSTSERESRLGLSRWSPRSPRDLRTDRPFISKLLGVRASYKKRGEYLRFQPSPEIRDFWCANETCGLVNAG